MITGMTNWNWIKVCSGFLLVYPKKPDGFFLGITQVSEPWMLLLLLSVSVWPANFPDLLQVIPGHPDVKFQELLEPHFCRPDPYPLTRPTVSNHWKFNQLPFNRFRAVQASYCRCGAIRSWAVMTFVSYILILISLSICHKESLVVGKCPFSIVEVQFRSMQYM